jgi:hypothetical protein
MPEIGSQVVASDHSPRFVIVLGTFPLQSVRHIGIRIVLPRRGKCLGLDLVQQGRLAIVTHNDNWLLSGLTRRHGFRKQIKLTVVSSLVSLYRSRPCIMNCRLLSISGAEKIFRDFQTPLSSHSPLTVLDDERYDLSSLS